MIGQLAGNLLLAAVPSLLLLLVFHGREKRLHVRPGLVFAVFAAGFLALPPTLAAGFASRLAGGFLPADCQPAWNAFITAGLLEESAKYATVRLTAFRRLELSSPLDGVIYTISAGLGFAFFENIFYLSEGLTLLLRAATTVPLHAASAAVLGWFIGRAKARPGSSVAPGLLLAVLIHGGDHPLVSRRGPVDGHPHFRYIETTTQGRAAGSSSGS
jgi:protease PrsW